MKVVAHEPEAWYLLGDGDDYFLDVRCEGYATDYSMLVMFSPQERDEYLGAGRSVAERLAGDVRNHPRQYSARNLLNRHGDRVLDAIRLWKSTSGGKRL